MALCERNTAIHKRRNASRRNVTHPLHRRRQVSRRGPPMMRGSAAMTVMVVAIIRWGGLSEEPPISVGNAPHARCPGRTDIRRGWIKMEAMPPNTERLACRRRNVEADRIWARSQAPVMHLSGGRMANPLNLNN
jgi:hypothetical protein